jgi:hypothetical protein
MLLIDAIKKHKMAEAKMAVGMLFSVPGLVLSIHNNDLGWIVFFAVSLAIQAVLFICFNVSIYLQAKAEQEPAPRLAITTRGPVIGEMGDMPIFEYFIAGDGIRFVFDRPVNKCEGLLDQLADDEAAVSGRLIYRRAD